MIPARPPTETDQSQAPVTRLRGASVGPVNTRRVGQVLAGLCLVTLTTLFVVFLLGGLHKNAQISSLRQHGVTVDVTVTRCVGLLGGSGSNTSGYSCRGTLMLNGQRHDEAIPGTAFLSPGQKIRVVTVPGDPALLAPVHTVAHEHTSWTVLLVPAILLVALLALIALLVFVSRRRGGVRHGDSLHP
jgi:hypothetical protein